MEKSFLIHNLPAASRILSHKIDDHLVGVGKKLYGKQSHANYRTWNAPFRDFRRCAPTEYDGGLFRSRASRIAGRSSQSQGLLGTTRCGEFERRYF